MKITQEKAVGEPRKILTVKRRSENLKEHKEAFDAANNPRGYIKEKRPATPIEERLLEMVKPEFKSIERAKDNNYTIRKMSKETGTPMQVNVVYNALARGLGYSNWAQAMQSSTDGVFIRNLNYGLSRDEVLSAIEGRAMTVETRLRFDRPMPYGQRLLKNIHGATVFRKNDNLKEALKSLAIALGHIASNSLEYQTVCYAITRDGEDMYILAREINPTTLPPRMVRRKLKILPSANVVEGFEPIEEYTGHYDWNSYKYCLLEDKQKIIQENNRL